MKDVEWVEREPLKRRTRRGPGLWIVGGVSFPGYCIEMIIMHKYEEYEIGNVMRIKVKLFKMEQKKAPGCELLAAFLFLILMLSLIILRKMMIWILENYVDADDNESLVLFFSWLLHCVCSIHCEEQCQKVIWDSLDWWRYVKLQNVDLTAKLVVVFVILVLLLLPLVHNIYRSFK